MENKLQASRTTGHFSNRQIIPTRLFYFSSILVMSLNESLGLEKSQNRCSQIRFVSSIAHMVLDHVMKSSHLAQPAWCLPSARPLPLTDTTFNHIPRKICMFFMRIQLKLPLDIFAGRIGPSCSIFCGQPPM